MHRDTVSRQARAVVSRTGANEQVQVLPREEVAARRVGKTQLLLLLEPRGLGQNTLVAGGLVQTQQAPDEEGIVVEERGHRRAAFAPGVREDIARRHEGLENEARRSGRRLDEHAEHRVRPPRGQGRRWRDRSSRRGPCRPPGRRRVARAARSRSRPRACARRGSRGRVPPRGPTSATALREVEHITVALEVRARRRSPKTRASGRRRSRAPNAAPRGSTRSRLPSSPSALGVDGREEGAIGRAAGHSTQELGRRERHLGEAPTRGERLGLGVELDERGVVVEHLLEVGHEPLGVHRVAVEARRPPGRGCRRGPCRRASRRASPRLVVARSGEVEEQVEVRGRRELRGRGRSRRLASRSAGARAATSRLGRRRRRAARRLARPAVELLCHGLRPRPRPAGGSGPAGAPTPRAPTRGSARSRGGPRCRAAGSTSRRRRA